MAVYMGRDGFIAELNSTTPVGYMDTWSLSPELEPLEITGYGESHKQYTAGVRNWNVTFSGTLDRANVRQRAVLDKILNTGSTDLPRHTVYMIVQQGTSGTGVPAAGATSQYWSGIVYANATINAQIGDRINVTFNGVSHDDLTYTDAT